MREITANAKLILAAAPEIGERPVFEPTENVLYWVDCTAPAIHRLDLATGLDQHWDLPKRIGSFALKENKGALLGLADGVYDFDFTTSELRPKFLINQPEYYFLNDGRCDARGRFFVGSANSRAEPLDVSNGYVYRVDAQATVPVFDGIIAINGIAWSDDTRTMYAGCSVQDVIWAFDYDIETGTPSNRRIFVRPGIPLTYLDGAAVDVEGGYWSTIFGAGVLQRYLPDGTLDTVLKLPLSQPTMLCFGGADFSEAFVTTGAGHLDPRMPVPEPDDGGILRLDMPVRGRQEPKFRG